MPLTILAADDDLATRLAICDYLEASGYSVVMAENGQEALAMVETFRPHLIITDIVMPQMDGYQLVEQVRQKPDLRLLPVIFLTARTHTQERIRGYQVGCDLYLPKPFDLQELGAAVRNLLERSQIIQTQMLQAEWRSNSVESPLRKGGPESNHLAKTTTTVTVSLTDREREVLELLADGLSNGQIGDRLHLSPRTVEKYVSSLLRKIEVSNRTELVRFAIEHDLT